MTNAPFSGKTAILIEDVHYERYADNLEALGMNVIIFNSHFDLQEQTQTLEKADLIITDNHMWYFDEDDIAVDEEMVEWLGKWLESPDNPNADTPVLFITDSQKATARMSQAMNQGFSGFIWKSQRVSDCPEGIFVSEPGLSVVLATMDHPEEGKMYVTPLWKSIILSDLDDEVAKSPETDDDERLRLETLEKITQNDADMLQAGLITPDERGIDIKPQHRDDLTL